MSSTAEEEEVICKYILRIQKKISEPDLPEEKVVKYLHNLNKLPISVKSLKTTGIGKVVNELKKKDGLVGKKALELVARWKHKFSPKKNDNHTDKDRNDEDSKIHQNGEKNERNEHRNDKTEVTNNHDKLHKIEEKIVRTEHKRDKSKVTNNHDKMHKNDEKISRTEHKSDSKVSKKHKQEEKEKSGKPKMPSFKKPPDHWKDVSLNLLGDPSKKAKKKRKAMNGDVSESPSKKEKQLPDTDKKKHVIPVRRDPGMPSLPDIQLPEIQRTYRPMHFSNYDDDNESRKKRKVTMNEMDFNVDIVSRKSRTQVFSGRKSITGGVVPSLYQQCMRILIENIDALEDTGGVPFDILEPLLSKTSPIQLVRLEEFNPYFTEDTGELWKLHCQKEFRGHEPQDMESYREMYFRLCKERAEKLKNIQSKITESQAKKDPARQAKLAYIAGPPKPSAQIRRKQIRHGTGEEVDRVIERQKQIKSQIENRHREQAAHTIPFNKIPKRERTAPEAVQARPRPRPDFIPKKAASKPMMKAAMKMMKSQRNRGTVRIIRK